MVAGEGSVPMVLGLHGLTLYSWDMALRDIGSCSSGTFDLAQEQHHQDG